MTSPQPMLYSGIPDSLGAMAPQPAVTRHLMAETLERLATLDPGALGRTPFPRFTVTPRMLGPFRDFDPEAYWGKLLADDRAEHLPPDLPAYTWIADDLPGIRDYYRHLRPFSKWVYLATYGARYQPRGPWFDLLRSRIGEFTEWARSDSFSIWAGDYDLLEIAEGFAVFLDLCGRRLSVEENGRLLDGLEAVAVKISEVLSVYQPHRYPHDSHIFSQAGMYAELGVVLAAAGREAGRKALAYWTEEMPRTWPCFGAADGGWYMGTAYWKWQLAKILTAVEGMASLGFVDLRRTPFLEETGYFKYYAQPPHTRSNSLGDQANHRPLPHDLALMRYLGKLTGEGHFISYADAFTPLRGHEYDPGPETGGVKALLTLLRTHDIPSPSAPLTPLPLTRVFPETGVAVCHTDHGRTEDNVSLVFRSSPFGSIGHGHADQNHFMVEAWGEPIFIDSGYYPSFHEPHHRAYTQQTRAHNTLLINGMGQTPRNLLAKGRLTHVETLGPAEYIFGECGKSYMTPVDLFRRHLLFHPHPTTPWLLVVDHVILPQPGSVDFLLHSYEEPRWNPDQREAFFYGWRFWGQRARCRMKFLTPHAFHSNITDTFPYPATGRELNQPRQWHAAFTPAEPVREHWIAAGFSFYRQEARSDFLAVADAVEPTVFSCEPVTHGMEIHAGTVSLFLDKRTDRIILGPS